ncbi:MAG: hypothetical protein ABEN55_14725 [Bradymonadaceae bacterium]
MRALLKQADGPAEARGPSHEARADTHKPDWEDALFDPPIPVSGQERKTRGRAELIGGITGGLAGSVGGAALGKRNRGGGKAAIIGGATGAGIGQGVGRMIGSVIGSKQLLDERHSQGRPTYYQGENAQKMKDKKHMRHPTPNKGPVEFFNNVGSR